MSTETTRYQVIVRLVTEYSYIVAGNSEQDAMAKAQSLAREEGRHHDYTETCCIKMGDQK